VLIQMGLLGLIWMIVFFFRLFGFLGRKVERNTKLAAFLALIVIIMFFYVSAWRQPLFCIITFFAIMSSYRRVVPEKIEEEPLNDLDDAD
ncbi:MAG: hypothetical protein IK053_05045, partial [Muribaculaceae bacterium]|nr:hypothetical protein [Muribaculaceae bacterium]